MIERWLSDERRRAEGQLRVVDNGFVLGIAGLTVILLGIAVLGIVEMNVWTVVLMVLLGVFVTVMAVQHFFVFDYIRAIDNFYLTTMHRFQEDAKREATKSRMR